MHVDRQMTRIAIAIALGVVAYLALPVAGNLQLVVFGSLVLRATTAACVVGLLGGPVRPRWLVPSAAAVAVLAGFLIRGFTMAVYIDVRGLLVGMAWAALLSYGLAWGMAAGYRRIAVAACLAAVIATFLWFSGFLPGPLSASSFAQDRLARNTREYPPEGYAFDGIIFLRTSQLMKEGMPYYQAFRKAVVEDARLDEAALNSPFNYREPLIFWMWRLLPGSSGYDLLRWFVVWSVATMIVAYVLASSFVEPGIAILAPICLVPFFTLFCWTSSMWFTMVEVWGAVLLIGAVAALIRGRGVLSILLLTLAVATRELNVVLVPAWVAAWWFSSPDRKANWWFPAAAVGAPIAVIVAHVMSVPPLAATGPGMAFWMRGGWERLLQALLFGWDKNPGVDWLPFALVALAIAAALLARPRWKMAFLALATIVPPAFLVLFSNGSWGYYWGGFYTPLAVSLAPAVLARWFPAQKHAA